MSPLTILLALTDVALVVVCSFAFSAGYRLGGSHGRALVDFERMWSSRKSIALQSLTEERDAINAALHEALRRNDDLTAILNAASGA